MNAEALALAVYKLRLEDASKGAVKRMLDADNDGGLLMKQRSASYLPIVRACLKALTNEATNGSSSHS
jgi:hypothetical protein